MTHWMVFGASGQLGSDLQKALGDSGQDRHPNRVTSLTSRSVDITVPDQVEAAISHSRPDVVINAAAYTAVDQAEEQPEVAMAVNGTGAGIIAASCAPLADTRLVHISTDYVFSGEKQGEYAEDDPTCPRTVYGASKQAGEEAVMQALPGRSSILRTAWLYGASGGNFVRTILELASRRETIEVVDDQRGQPTWSLDLAHQILLLMEVDGPPGVYHATNSGSTTWYGLAQEVYRLAGLDPDRIRPTSTESFARPAPRPANSVLGHARWESAGLPPMRNWEEALAAAMPLMVR